MSGKSSIDEKHDSQIVRSISMDSIPSTISSFFQKKNKKRRLDDSNSSTPGPSSPHESELDSESNLKKRKVLTKEQEDLLEREKVLDAELPEELRKFRPRGFKFNIPPKDRPIRVYADGVFDLFHLGHMKQLEQAKKSLPNVELVCGVPSDRETHKRKGLTVLTDKQRCDSLLHCKWVDEVISDAPWCVTPEFLTKHRIDYVAHDDLPYASTDSDDIYKPIKEKGMFLTTQRTDGISTSDIITKVIRDYDKYLMRNFARGATRKELNVSWLKKNELEFKKHISDFRTYWMKNKTNINNVSKDLYFEVREYLRGKRKQGQLSPSLSTMAASDSEEFSRASSPLTEFASKYIGNKNRELNELPKNKSIFANVREKWGKDSTEDEEASDLELPISQRLSRTKQEDVDEFDHEEHATKRKIKKPVSRKKK